ncbi:eukaryotic aspartyl protease (macronuclear) [Tetrahymena thermophila SB210]|uniref:Eukaryotic aspartyl protease n=1 Tax=Tetrahymena thermophila (strain SB210) TaxID=312017 RepID=Q235M1_TETTS|nr:eukaryotic aspartyl protease [Tetrahymena thermophila SB210]EAR92259.1 eukaryotic aspartyl protease [Tetrahymena thermophila SB210]|eukprot:XP_001012504.1 eukaryotic aspartyl protease [Tetrahymena thermophila SB210]
MNKSLMKSFLVIFAFAALGQCLLSIPLKKSIPFRQTFDTSSNSHLRKNVVNNLVNYQDGIYYAEVKIGKSQQPLQVIFDSSSSEFWIASSKCQSCVIAQMQTYDCKVEDLCITQEEQLVYQFETGFITGNLAKFYLGVPETNSIDYFGVLINEVERIPSRINGVFGLIPSDNLTDTLTQPNLVLQLHQTQQIEKPLLSFYFALEQDEKAGKQNSSVTFGGYDDSKIVGQIEYFKTVQQNTWFVEFNDFEVDGVNVFSQVNYALIDTSSPLFQFNPNIAEKFQAILAQRGIYIGSDNQIPCNSDLPTIAFTLRNTQGNLVKFEVEPSFYLIQSSNLSNVCYLYVYGDCQGPALVVGSQFIKKYLTIFDYEQKTIGLARSINNPQQSTLQN